MVGTGSSGGVGVGQPGEAEFSLQSLTPATPLPFNTHHSQSFTVLTTIHTELSNSNNHLLKEISISISPQMGYSSVALVISSLHKLIAEVTAESRTAWLTPRSLGHDTTTALLDQALPPATNLKCTTVHTCTTAGGTPLWTPLSGLGHRVPL